MSSLESRLAAEFDGQSRPLDPGVTDPDFDLCIIARVAMTEPCGWTTKTFCEVLYYFDTTDDFQTVVRAKACWGGHILLAMGVSVGALSTNGGYQIGAADVVRLKEIIIDKLGFALSSDLYDFNDHSTHDEVIAEFDRRLQAWGDR